MIGKSVVKVKEGKMIRAMLEVGNDDTIRRAVLSGDFFAHPENFIEEIESALCGVKFSRTAISDIVRDCTKNVQIIGVRPEDIIEAIVRAYKNAKR